MKTNNAPSSPVFQLSHVLWGNLTGWADLVLSAPSGARSGGMVEFPFDP